MQDFNAETFFSMSREMLCIASVDGYFKKVNPSFIRVLGWSEAELIGKPFNYFIHPDDIQKTQDEVIKLAQGKPTVSFQNRYRCADETYRYLLWSSTPDTKTGLLYAIAHDITGQIKDEILIAEQAQEILAEKEKLEVLKATMLTVEDIVINAFNGLSLFQVQARKNNAVSSEALDRYTEIINDATSKLRKLSNLKKVTTKEMSIGSSGIDIETGDKF